MKRQLRLIAIIGVVVLLSACGGRRNKEGFIVDKVNNTEVTRREEKKETRVKEEDTSKKEEEEKKLDHRSPEEIAQLKEELLALKQPFKLGLLKAEDYIDENQTTDNLLELINYVVKHQEHRQVADHISLEEAKSDLDDYFSFLQKCYAGYGFFGGSGNFSKAKNNIIRNIPKEGIAGKELEKLMKEEMSFVLDSHFTVGLGHDMMKIRHREVDKLYFMKDGEGYFNRDSGLYLDKEVDLDSYLKPSLDLESRIVYKLITSFDEDYPETISYEDGTVEKLDWKGIRVTSLTPLKKAEIKTIKDIPYLKFDAGYFKGYSPEDYETVLEGARKLSQAKYGILDLRGHSGGNAILSGEWIKEYSGNEPAHSYDGVFIASEDLYADTKSGHSYEEGLRYMGYKNYSKNHDIQQASDVYYERDGILLVLMDGHVASAAEYLIDMLHHYSNTIFVGAPSYGALRSSAYTHYYMPNSGIVVQFGNILALPNEEYFQEGKGFQPNIWLTSHGQEEQLAELLRTIRDSELNK